MRNILLFIGFVLSFLVFVLVRSAYPGFAYICLFTSIILFFITLSFLPSSTKLHPSQTSVRASPPPTPVRPTPLSIPRTAQAAHMTLTDMQFELFAAAVLIGTGYRGYTFVRHCGKTGDKGVDVLLEDRFHRTICVQAKRYKMGNTVKAHQVREFSASIGWYGSQHGYIVTTSALTRDGKKHIEHENFRFSRGPQGKDMQVIDHRRLDELLQTDAVAIDQAWKHVLKKHAENKS